MAPNNTSTKMSVDFDLTDIEDIDAISDEFDADPSSDDDTFISNKNKKITKKRPNIIKNINNNNGASNIEKMGEQGGTIKTSILNFNGDHRKQNQNDDSEDEKEYKN
jgi:hypothetical protein